jgi:hypothetical protein
MSKRFEKRNIQGREVMNPHRTECSALHEVHGLEHYTNIVTDRLLWVEDDRDKLKAENEKLKAEIERLKVCELKTYHDGYKDGLTACNTVGAEEALKDKDFHYSKWIEKKEQGE